MINKKTIQKIKPKMVYDEDNKITYAYLEYYDKELKENLKFVGISKCSEEDKDFYSKLVGSNIASNRAKYEMLKFYCKLYNILGRTSRSKILKRDKRELARYLHDYINNQEEAIKSLKRIREREKFNRLYSDMMSKLP